MLFPDSVHHGIDRHPLGLRQEEDHEDPHCDDPGGEEEEDGSLHGTEHGEEGLGDEEGEEHVWADGEGKAGGSRLHGEGFARDEPAQGSPWPRERHHVGAH